MCFATKILVVLLCCGSVRCKTCFDCIDLPHPRDCRKVVECPESDVCFVDQFVTGGGLVLYNTGCRSTQRCQQSGKRNIGPRADLLLCSDCCSGDYCNLAGCGQTAPVASSRGPYCFACDSQSSEGNCRNIKLCDTDKVCMLTYSQIDHFYTSTCALTSQCHDPQTPLIGRSMGSKRTTCHACCNSDFCNDNCTQVKINGNWSPWGQWKYTVTCGHGQRSRSRLCDNPAPQNGGTSCSGASVQTEKCTLHACTHAAPINGGWSSWGQWSGCSTTCGQGQGQGHRTRMCNNPTPAHGGTNCVGPSHDYRNCTNNVSCPITRDTCELHPGYEWHVTSDGTYEYHACLKLYQVPHEFAGARRTCHLDHAKMYTAYNRTRQLEMKGFLAAKREKALVWLGLQNTPDAHHVWFWDSPDHHRMTFQHFQHPSDIYSVHGCAVVNPATVSYYWFVKNCYTKHHVLCEII